MIASHRILKSIKKPGNQLWFNASTNSCSNVDYGISLPLESSERIMAVLVTPIAFGAFVLLIYVARRDQRFLEISPLIFVQVNMIFVWICTGTFFLYNIAGQCTSPTFYNIAIGRMLTNTNNLVPLNVFMYSWRYLSSMENEQKGKWRQLIRLFRIITLWAVPVTYYALYVALVITNSLSIFCALNNPIDSTNQCDQRSKQLTALN